FNMTGSPMAYGIQLEYYFSPTGGPAGSGDAPFPTVTVLNNTFTDGVTHLFFNCNLAGITPFYIYNNTFVRTSDASGIGISASRITGRFTNNTFSTNQFTKNVTLIECNLDLYGNYFSGNVNSNLELDVNSYCRLEPLIVNGEYIWLGGFNEINMNNSSVAQNITFTYGSFPATDRGRNCFVLNNNNFNIFGDIEESFGRAYYTRYNDWNQGPNFKITQGGQNIDVIYLPINECIPTEELDNYLLYYQVIDLGNGIYDSIPVTSSPGGASVPPDLALYIAARNHKNQRNYHLAIDNLKSLVNQFDSSKYLYSALNDLFINYKLTDSTGNQSIRNQLFGELRTYLEDKLQQYQGIFSVSDRIYGYFLMCLVMQRQYSQAISGYENIMNNHPNAMSRLKASWDRAAAIIAQQQGGSGGGESQETEPSSDRKPPHLTAKEIYEDQKQHRNKITESNRDNESSRDAVAREFDRKKDNLIQSRVTYLNPLNRVDLFEKIKEDIRIINNIKPQGNIKDNSLPKRFQLHQNYPNPFNPVTKIKYELPKDINVTITIYDILGREVTKLVNNEYRKAGVYEAEWNALNYASGVYFYRIEAGSFIDAKKMVLVR
ncbi:MAG: T9SS type A sorting domain-containing protein, partial [Ignavibacteria bacterium]|nr:T9SS type A sorting domain-containing protein [Ignavibacteria bacterium]